MADDRDPPEPPAQSSFVTKARDVSMVVWNKFNEPETIFGYHRDKVRKAILEFKTILEILALSAASMTLDY